MAWGAAWETPEQAAEKSAARDADQAARRELELRLRLEPFERLLLDVLGEIRDMLRPAGAAEPRPNETSAAQGKRDGSAEPGDPARSGSAHPDFHAGAAWIRDLLVDFDVWLTDQLLDDERDRDQLVDDFLAELTTENPDQK